jgi:FMN phosphatase YigB (HAD superfamily)
MSFSFEKWKGFINESKLRVFDFDDTLVRSQSKIKVTYPDGTVEYLTSAEYAAQGENPENEYDFSDFEEVINPQEIEKVTNILRNVVNAGTDGREVVILTARRPISEDAIKEYLEEIGIDASKITFVLLGDADPLAKSNWIENKIKDGTTDILFLDDSGKNVDAVLDLKQQYPDIKIDARQVKYAEDLPEKEPDKQIDPEVLQIIEDHVELPIRAMRLRDDDTILVYLAEEYTQETMDEINEWWEQSDYFKEIQQMGYTVKLLSNGAPTQESSISLTKELL